VTSDVLIPRPDTETLAEHALECIPKDLGCRVLDVGTGSGVLAITIAAERPSAEVTATDISAAALEVASENSRRLEVADRIQFRCIDLLSRGDQYDVIVSNPPYVARRDMETLEVDVRQYEPRLALEAGEDGLDVVRALLTASAAVAQPGSQMLLEIGAGQAGTVFEIARSGSSWEPVAVYPDLNRVERVVHLRRI
jgi:release factor glutamine methyltransferase